MPNAGPYRTASIFLGHRQGAIFQAPRPTGVSISDKNGISRPIFTGRMDAERENYGVFENGSLIASLTLASPLLTGQICPTPYWSVGMIEVATQFQGRRVGPQLLDAVFDLRGRPLASDVNQDGGGADLWRRWIRDHPGKVELHSPNGDVAIVARTPEGYVPDPWNDGRTRLVRRS